MYVIKTIKKETKPVRLLMGHKIAIAIIKSDMFIRKKLRLTNTKSPFFIKEEKVFEKERTKK